MGRIPAIVILALRKRNFNRAGTLLEGYLMWVYV